MALTAPTPTMVKVCVLHFDRRNSRLVEMNISDSTPDDEIMQMLWDTMDVEEVVHSIAVSGFFLHEPLIVAWEEGKQIIIEGNRRLAAVHILLRTTLAAKINAQASNLNPDARMALAEVPVIYGSRESVWRYLGFKHINGPAKWSSYAKACFVARIHREHNESLDAIAHQIGDTHRTIHRLFRGLMVIEQAERMKVFNRNDRYINHFSFSHLYIGLGYEGISGFISVSTEDDESRDPVPEDRQEELGELLLWLYGNRRDRIPPVVQWQNLQLKQLDIVVAHDEALATLRAGHSLEYALTISQAPAKRFRKSLLTAKQVLQQAQATLTMGYDGSGELVRMAHEVANLADDLCVEMALKNPGRRRDRMEVL